MRLSGVGKRQSNSLPGNEVGAGQMMRRRADTRWAAKCATRTRPASDRDRPLWNSTSFIIARVQIRSWPCLRIMVLLLIRYTHTEKAGNMEARFVFVVFLSWIKIFHTPLRPITDPLCSTNLSWSQGFYCSSNTGPMLIGNYTYHQLLLHVFTYMFFRSIFL